MKLVDILARELKVWPEGVAAITQTTCSPVLRDSSYQAITPVTQVSRIADDAGGHSSVGVTIIRTEWQAAVDALNADKCEHSYANNIGCPECGELNAPKVVEWDGKGNPPAGSSIEYSIGDGWYSCEVRYVLNRDDCPGISLVAWCEHLGKDQYLSNDRDHKFRPARTAEQVAAEEREKAIKEMMQHGVDAGDSTIECSCAALYDAGYRKEPKPCGS